MNTLFQQNEKKNIITKKQLGSDINDLICSFENKLPRFAIKEEILAIKSLQPWVFNRQLYLVRVNYCISTLGSSGNSDRRDTIVSCKLGSSHFNRLIMSFVVHPFVSYSMNLSRIVVNSIKYSR